MTDSNGQFDYEAQRLMESRVSTLLQKMSSSLSEESARLGCWGVIGQGTGGQLLSGNTPASKDEIFSKDFISIMRAGTFCSAPLVKHSSMKPGVTGWSSKINVPHTTQSGLLMTLKKKAFKNIVGKGENASNQHFLLFQQGILLIP